MALGGIFNHYANPYSNYNAYSASSADRAPISPDPDHQVKAGYKSSPAECQTCKERKYQDGSNEDDVSFKSPGHIAPGASAATVSAHEHEHVVNAYEKAAKSGGKVLSCTVTLQTAVCPECGTSFVAGGKTSTAISYPKDSQDGYVSPKGIKPAATNPYTKGQRARNTAMSTGARIDYTADQYKNNISFS